MNTKDINLEDYEILEQSDEKIVLKKKWPKYPKWEDLKKISGCYITDNCIIRPASNVIANGENKNVFLSEKHAKSVLAMAQISQFMPYYGGEITDEEWENSCFKPVIERVNNRIYTTSYFDTYKFLAFHTKEQRDMFLENNEQLVKDYLMIE